MMKKLDFLSMNLTQLQDQLSIIRNEYQRLKIQTKIVSIQNPMRIRILRKNLARIKTLINNKMLKNRL